MRDSLSDSEKPPKFSLAEAYWKRCDTHKVDFPAASECPKCSSKSSER